MHSWLVAVVGVVGACAGVGTEIDTAPAEPLPVVVVEIDPESNQLAAEMAGVPDDPRARLMDFIVKWKARVLLARLSQRLSEAPAPPAVLASDFRFATSDYPAGAELAAALAASRIPIVLAHDGSALDPAIHVPPGGNRFEGHPWGVFDYLSAAPPEQISRTGVPLEDVLRNGRPMQTGGRLPMGAAMVVAALSATMPETMAGAPEARTQAESRVRAVAGCLLEPFHWLDSWGQPLTVVQAVPVVPGPEPRRLSAAAVLRDDALRDSLAGAVVLVTDGLAAPVPIGGGASRPGSFGDAWVYADLWSRLAIEPACPAASAAP